MKSNKIKKMLALFVAVVMSLAIAGCGDSNAGIHKKDNSLNKVLDAGQLILGFDAGFPPMGFINESVVATGFDIDVAHEVCRRLGVTLVPLAINWDEKDDDLNSGKIDCIWNGLSVTPARAEEMCLSDPYMKSEIILVVRSDSEAKNARDLAGRSIGYQSGSTAEELLNASDIYPTVTAVPFNNNMMLLQQLAQGKIDAAIVDSVTTYYFITRSEASFYVLSDTFSEEEYAIGFRKGDQALRDRIQELISIMKADGTLAHLSRKWFGSDITTVK